MKRRNFLSNTSKVVGTALLVSPMTEALGKVCGLTPPQTSGPFYPGDKNFTTDRDLTRIPGSSRRAVGQVIYVSGVVVDQNCQPVVDANVEIWQACHSGKYKHSRDPNPAPLDPNFQYWAECNTNQKGQYGFKTILPGAYPADRDWTRPPHIHFRVSKIGYRELVTQMYFSGNPLNDRDLILKNLSPEDQKKVVVEFKKSQAQYEPGSLWGEFEVSIQKIKES